MIVKALFSDRGRFSLGPVSDGNSVRRINNTYARSCGSDAGLILTIVPSEHARVPYSKRVCVASRLSVGSRKIPIRRNLAVRYLARDCQILCLKGRVRFSQGSVYGWRLG